MFMYYFVGLSSCESHWHSVWRDSRETSTHQKWTMS